jgi:DNA-binding HxlR family transcriptional regulator
MSDDHELCGSFRAAMKVLAKPWNGMIMTVLMGGPLRFSEIAARVPNIGDRMLTARLKELEKLALLVRRVEPGPPVRVSYELTETGRAFDDVGDAITAWGRMIERGLQATQTPVRAAYRPRARARA